MTPALHSGGGGGGVIISTTQPDYEEGKTWYNPNTGVYHVGADRGGGGDWHSIPPVQYLDETDTFKESGVTLTQDTATIQNGKLGLFPNDETVYGDPYPNTNTTSSWAGITINPNKPITKVGGQIYDYGGPFDEARLVDSSGTVLKNKTGLNLGASDIFTFDVSANPLSTGTEYYIEARNSAGTDYAWDGSPNHPKSGTGADLTAGAFGGGSESGNQRTVRSAVIEYEESSATPVVDWGMPDSVESWDLATLDSVADGASVSVDVIDGGGNVLFSDIGKNFDISTVSTGTNVRLRVNLSRTAGNWGNNPHVTYLARRYLR